jgi:hypothetical protein
MRVPDTEPTSSWDLGSPSCTPPTRHHRRLVIYGGYAAFDSSPPAILFVVRSDIMIVAPYELTSPAGTKSILMHFGTGFDQYSVSNARMLTNAFYGEPVNGNWVLAFYDFCYPNGTPTVLTSVPQVYFSGR